MAWPPTATDVDALRISAVIPTYNRADLVVRAVECARSQRRPPDEIVVVDDGSTDDTRERLEALSHDGLKLVSQANYGAAIARNRGVVEASGDWIAFLDSDDLWVPQHLERMAAAIGATAGAADLYFGDTRFSREDGTSTSFWSEADFAISASHQTTLDASDWVSRPVHPMLLQASVVSRHRFLGCGGFWSVLASREDTHFFLKIGLGGPACAVADAGAQMTGDDCSGRLTLLHSPETESYWRATVRLYDDILALGPHVSTDILRLLRGRLSVGHWRLGRLLLAAGRRRDFSRELVRAFAARPREVPEHLLRRLAQRLSESRPR